MNTKKIILPKIYSYCIYDTVTQKYSQGGMRINKIWSDKPKLWSKLGHLKAHLTELCISCIYGNKQFTIYPYYKNAIVCDVFTNEKDILDIHRWLLYRAEKYKRDIFKTYTIVDLYNDDKD